MIRVLKDFSRERELFTSKNGREPLISELAEKLSVSVELLSEALSSGQPVMSLTGTSDDGDEQIDISVDSPDEKISDRIALHQILGELNAEDRKLIYFRYYKNLTQSKTAQIMNITQVQVSRKEKKILLQMREKFMK